MAEDRAVELLERMLVDKDQRIAWLNSQVETLQNKLLALADPMALARIQATTQPRQEKKPVAPRPPVDDRLTDDERAAVLADNLPALTPERKDIERSFEAKA